MHKLIVMIKVFRLSILFLLFSIYQFNAQVVSKTDTLNGTELTVHMDEKVSNMLENMEEACDIKKSEPVRSTPAKSTAPTTKTSSKPRTTAEICRENPRLMGYKIQVAVVNNKKDADQIGLQFRRKFPSMKVQLDASLRPNYKVLAGSYLTRDSGAADLRRVRASFPSARLVQYMVFCAEAK